MLGIRKIIGVSYVRTCYSLPADTASFFSSCRRPGELEHAAFLGGVTIPKGLASKGTLSFPEPRRVRFGWADRPPRSSLAEFVRDRELCCGP